MRNRYLKPEDRKYLGYKNLMVKLAQKIKNLTSMNLTHQLSQLLMTEFPTVQLW